MENISVKPSTAVGVLGLILGLAFCDGWLLLHTQKQNAAIANANEKRAIPEPSPGESLGSIAGFSLQDGHPLQLTPAATPQRVALLVFREGCHFCEANWHNWEHLFGSQDSTLPVMFVTTDKVLSQAYRDAHPLLKKRPVVLSVSPATLESLKLGATPQTVYVVDGRLRQDWIGVLSDKSMREIVSTTGHS